MHLCLSGEPICFSNVCDRALVDIPFCLLRSATHKYQLLTSGRMENEGAEVDMIYTLFD
jgi:hypothetical protein